MQKVARKMTALLAVLVLAVGVFFTASPAMAAGDTGTLTITGNSELVGKKVYAIEMFSATKSGDNVAYTLKPQFEAFFKSNSKYGCDAQGLTSEEISQKAYEYVSSLDEDDAAEVTAFAEEAANWVLQNRESLSSYELSATGVAGDGQNSGKVVFGDPSGIEYGYYLVYPLGSTGNNNRGTNAMLVNVVDSAANVEIKSTYPTVDKTVDNENGSDNSNNHGGDASVGDTLTFTLTSAVPDMNDYTTYTFKFQDKLSKGLEYVTDSVKVTIGDSEPLTKLVKDTDYTVTGPTAGSGADEGKSIITIDLTTLKTKYSDKVGQTITVTYQAKVTDDALIIGDGANLNEASVVYSNDPTTDGTGESTTTETKTYTFGFTINKEDDKSSALENVTFKIWKDDGDGQFSAEGDTPLTFNGKVESGTNPVVDKYVLSETQDGTGTVITTTANDFLVCGLSEGTYWVEEIATVDGYNKLAKPMKVTISATYDSTTGECTVHTIKFVDVDGSEESAVHPSHTITIINKAGSLLPGTGGMGTVIFTVVGVAAIAGGTVWYVNRRRATASGEHTA